MQSSSRDRHRRNQILTSWLHCRFVSLALPAYCMLTCTCICKQAGVWGCGPSTAFVSTEPDHLSHGGWECGLSSFMA